VKHVVLAVGLGIAGVLVFVQPAWAAASVAPPIPAGVAPNEVTFSPIAGGLLALGIVLRSRRKHSTP